jgi:hypothetical protein
MAGAAATATERAAAERGAKRAPGDDDGEAPPTKARASAVPMSVRPQGCHPVVAWHLPLVTFSALLARQL